MPRPERLGAVPAVTDTTPSGWRIVAVVLALPGFRPLVAELVVLCGRCVAVVARPVDEEMVAAGRCASRSLAPGARAGGGGSDCCGCWCGRWWCSWALKRRRGHPRQQY